MIIRDQNNKWINTSVFREAGMKFMKDGYYCDYPEGTDQWFNFWKEERRRCLEGYCVGNQCITGDHYFYLNYAPIQKVEDMTAKVKSKKVTGFPDFWDGDYDYFWSREIARNGITEEAYKALHLHTKIPEKYLIGGKNMIIGKARRRGYSYKAGAISACNYFHRPNSLTILGAEDKKHLYPNGLFSKALDVINFVNANTAWTMPSDVTNKISQGHIRASYIEYVNGIRVEKGFKSEILSLTFKDNPDVARGKDSYDVFFEESGAFGVPGLLKASYNATKDTVMAGPIKTGMITVYGTSGDMEAGSVDYANMFNNPLANDFLPFYNVWDDKLKEQLCGFFHPINLNMEGYYDENGNSDLIGAKERELKEREILVDSGLTSTDLNSRMQEKPLTPAEAFSAVSKNIFPVVELKNQLNKVIANDWQKTKGTPVNLIYEDGKVIAKPILSGANPITTLYDIPDNVEGNIMIYEHPIPDPPRGLYKIGYDPVRQDDGTSLSAIIVYKGVHKHTQYHDIIVAEYIGRTQTPEDTDRIALMLADFYNTQVMYENEIPSVRNYFRRIKRLDALALQPDNVISKSIKKSKTARVYGCHMVPQLKDAGERYIQEWLLSTLDYDEHGNKITTIDRIYSRRLLEELIHYDRKGNFDLISALIMAMFQIQEEELDKEYGNKIENKNAKDIINMMYQMYNT